MASDPAAPRLSLPPVPDELRAASVAVWREPVTIDTYEPEDPDRYPMFLEQRVYQGSSGRVYPLPFHDRIATERPHPGVGRGPPRERVGAADGPARARRAHPRRATTRPPATTSSTATTSSSRRSSGSPGRGSPAASSSTGRSTTGPATFLPTDVEIEHDADGAVTVWCTDHDPFARMKGMHGVRLRPDRAVGRAAGAAVQPHRATRRPSCGGPTSPPRVHDDYQSFFPPDVRVRGRPRQARHHDLPAADRPLLRRRLPGPA